jgi:hypothetical protein
LRWRTKIEEFSPYLHYIQGEKNILADDLSRLHHLPTPAQLAKGKKLVEPVVVLDNEDKCDDEAFFLEQEFSELYDNTVWDCIHPVLLHHSISSVWVRQTLPSQVSLWVIS